MDWGQDHLRTYSLLIATVGQGLFVLLYATLPWFRSHIGRALFFKACTLFALLALGSIGRALGTPAPDAVFTLLYVAMAIGIWWQVAAFIRVMLGKESLDG